MSVSDGQRVNADVTNAAYISRTTDSDTVAVVSLNNVSSGGTIANAQQQINDNATNIASNDVDIANLQSTKIDVAEYTSKGDLLSQDGVNLERLPVGTDGQALVADSGESTGLKWDDLPGSQLTTKGDVLTRTSSALERLGVGSDNQVLTADAAEATGLKWATPSAGSTTLTVVTKVNDYTATLSDDVILIDASSNDVTITLPASSGNSGKVFTVKRIDSVLTNDAIVDGNAAETIDGKTTFPLTAEDETVEVMLDGTNAIVKSMVLTSYIEDVLGSDNTEDFTDSNYTDSGLTLDLPTNTVWELGFSAVMTTRISGSSTDTGAIVTTQVRTSADVLLDKAASSTRIPLDSSSTTSQQNHRAVLKELTVTTDTTYKLSWFKIGGAGVVAAQMKGGGSDAYTYMWAKRIK